MLICSMFDLKYQESNIPLSEKALDILVEKLDADGDGEIDYGLVVDVSVLNAIVG